jgi:hypothetical protein
MRIIFPLLITALWASVAIDIEGVWPPLEPARELQETLAQLEAPAATALLAQIQDRASRVDDQDLQEFKTLEPKQRWDVRIALPTAPRPPNQPVCG